MVNIAVTGHRPDKLGGYKNEKGHKAIRRHMRAFLEAAPDGELVIISGGALGIDQFWMEVGLFLKLPVIAALPFKDYDSRWPDFSRERYRKLLDRCEEVRYICDPGYDPEKLQKRNEWMVNECDVLVAYSNGSPGGTRNCLDYAVHMNKIINEFNTDDIIKAG